MGYGYSAVHAPNYSELLSGASGAAKSASAAARLGLSKLSLAATNSRRLSLEAQQALMMRSRQVRHNNGRLWTAASAAARAC